MPGMQGEQFQDQTDKFIKYTQDNKSHTFPSVPSQCLLEIYILPGKLTVMSALFTITTNKNFSSLLLGLQQGMYDEENKSHAGRQSTVNAYQKYKSDKEN